MAASKPKTFSTGLGLFCEHQRLLWWIYAVNFVLASLGTLGFTDRAGAILNHSLASQRLVHGFDFAAVVSLFSHPESPLEGSFSTMLGFSLVFTVFMLFATGGVLATYYTGRPLSIGEFFEACGHYFWRFLRQMILFALCLIPVGILIGIANKLYDRIETESLSPYSSFYFFAVAIFVIVILLMSLRLWFDMAEVIAVAEDETRIRKALKRAAGLLRRNFGSLFWLYLRISLVGWIGFGLALQYWKNFLRPESIGTALLVSQLMIIFWLATRLWQRASEALWYRKYTEAAAQVSAPASAPTAPAVVTPVAG